MRWEVTEEAWCVKDIFCVERINKLLLAERAYDFNLCLCRIYIPEILLALCLLICASYDLVLGSHKYYLYIYLQAFAFIIMGFGFVGTRTPCS
jgi:hypothetical protein